MALRFSFFFHDFFRGFYFFSSVFISILTGLLSKYKLPCAIATFPSVFDDLSYFFSSSFPLSHFECYSSPLSIMSAAAGARSLARVHVSFTLAFLRFPRLSSFFTLLSPLFIFSISHFTELSL